MDPRLALLAATLCGALAVAVVGLDVAYSMEARLERQDAQGAWQTVSSLHGRDVGYYGEPYPVGRYGGCESGPLRLVVDNHRPIGASVHVRVAYDNASSARTVALLDETWSLERFEGRTWDVPPIPAAAFPVEQRAPPDGGKPVPTAGSLHVYVTLGGFTDDRGPLSACVAPPGGA